MLSKIASDQYPVSELRNVFSHRIRTTGFQGSNPNVIVKFSLFSNIVAHFDSASESYSEVIDKALETISFFTNEGLHHLYEVDYIFTDENNQWVAVLKNGKDFLILNSSGEPIIAEMEELILSTSKLKGYYISHCEAFPYLNKMGEIIDSLLDNRSQLSGAVRKIADRCINNDWIRENILECLDELKALVSESSFLLMKDTKQRASGQ